MGADIRTVVLALGIAIFKPCHRKVCFQAWKKVKFVPTQWLRKHLISKCRAPDHSCSRCVWVWWFLPAPAPVNLSIMTSRARTLRNSILSCQRRTLWRRKTPTPGWRASWEPWRRAFWGNSTCQMFLRSTARSTLLSLWWSFTTSTPRTTRQSHSLMSYEASLFKVQSKFEMKKSIMWNNYLFFTYYLLIKINLKLCDLSYSQINWHKYLEVPTCQM